MLLDLSLPPALDGVANPKTSRLNMGVVEIALAANGTPAIVQKHTLSQIRLGGCYSRRQAAKPCWTVLPVTALPLHNSLNCYVSLRVIIFAWRQSPPVAHAAASPSFPLLAAVAATHPRPDFHKIHHARNRTPALQTPCRHGVETVPTYKTETRLRRRPDQTVTKTKLKLKLRPRLLNNCVCLSGCAPYAL